MPVSSTSKRSVPPGKRSRVIESSSSSSSLSEMFAPEETLAHRLHRQRYGWEMSGSDDSFIVNDEMDEGMRDILAERGSVEVVCEFCNEAYQFDAVDAEVLFRENVQSAAPERSH